MAPPTCTNHNWHHQNQHQDSKFNNCRYFLSFLMCNFCLTSWIEPLGMIYVSRIPWSMFKRWQRLALEAGFILLGPPPFKWPPPRFKWPAPVQMATLASNGQLRFKWPPAGLNCQQLFKWPIPGLNRQLQFETATPHLSRFKWQPPVQMVSSGSNGQPRFKRPAAVQMATPGGFNGHPQVQIAIPQFKWPTPIQTVSSGSNGPGP